jgi:uncharacterized protein
LHVFFENLNYLDPYHIQFKGLKEGVHNFSFEVSDRFFQEFEMSEVTSGEFRVKLELNKKALLMVFHFDIDGTAVLTCDRCLEAYNQPVNYSGDLFVKFGPETLERVDDLLVLSSAESELDVSQYIYESINLCIPLKRVHPDDEDGIPACDTEMLERIGEMSPDAEHNHENEIDPRWIELQKLVNNN